MVYGSNVACFFQLFSLLICIEYPLQGTRELKKLTLWLMFFSLMLATNLLLRIQALPLACSYASFCCNEALGIQKTWHIMYSVSPCFAFYRLF